MNWLFIAIINVVVSLVVPGVLARFITPAPTIFELETMGGLIFIGLNLLELLYLTKELLGIRRAERRAWIEQDEFDALLTRVRADYRNMMHSTEGENVNFFRQLIRQRVEKLRDDVHIASEAKELYVENNHTVDTTKVTDLFRHGKAHVFREIFKVLDGSQVFDVYGGNYFKKIYDLTQSGILSDIRALIVVDSTNKASLKKATQLASFYRTTAHYAARTIAQVDYDKVHRDCGLEQFEDFGIYGEALLFRTLGYEPSRGKYCYDSLKIKKHTDFFDVCWNLHSVIELAESACALTLDEVLKL